MFDLERFNSYCNNYLAEKEEEYNSDEDFDRGLYEDYLSDQAEADRLDEEFL